MLLILPSPSPASQRHILSPLSTHTATTLVQAAATSPVDDCGRTLTSVPSHTLTLGPHPQQQTSTLGKLRPEQELLLCPKAHSEWLPLHPTESQCLYRGLKGLRGCSACALPFTDSPASSLDSAPWLSPFRPHWAPCLDTSGKPPPWGPCPSCCLEHSPVEIRPAPSPAPSCRLLPRSPCVGSTGWTPFSLELPTCTPTLSAWSARPSSTFSFLSSTAHISAQHGTRRHSPCLLPSALAGPGRELTEPVSIWFPSVFQTARTDRGDEDALNNRVKQDLNK